MNFELQGFANIQAIMSLVQAHSGEVGNDVNVFPEPFSLNNGITFSGFVLKCDRTSSPIRKAKGFPDKFVSILLPQYTKTRTVISPGS